MKTNKKKPAMRSVCLGCLLSVVILSHAKSSGLALTIFGQEKNNPSLFTTNSSILSGNQLLVNRSNIVDNHSAILEPLVVNGADPIATIVNSEKDLLFEAPEGGGIPLGTPIRDAGLFLALAGIAYGIVGRYKNSSHTTTKGKQYENNAK
jgi:hypothetical protein